MPPRETVSMRKDITLSNKLYNEGKQSFRTAFLLIVLANPDNKKEMWGHLQMEILLLSYRRQKSIKIKPNRLGWGWRRCKIFTKHTYDKYRTHLFYYKIILKQFIWVCSENLGVYAEFNDVIWWSNASKVNSYFKIYHYKYNY